MLLAVTFLSVLSTVLGVYWLLVGRREAEARMRIQQRLAVGVAAAAAPGGGIVRAGWNEPGWRGVGALVQRTRDFSSRIVGMLTRRQRRRLEQFESQLPRALDLLSRALRAGHGFTTALALVAEELPDPLRTEFRITYEQHNYGMPLPAALKDFVTRVPLLDARFLVTAVLTQRETGGNLAEVLDNLASVMRDRMRVRRQVQVLTAQGRLTGWVLGAFPLVLSATMWLWSPAQMTAMLEDPLGVRLLATAGVLELIGIVVIQRIVTVEY
jgi:Flp pilus assembly protein TadB